MLTLGTKILTTLVSCLYPVGFFLFVFVFAAACRILVLGQGIKHLAPYSGSTES